jgi:hypothetical protein
MTSVLSAITKLPRYIKVRSTNGLDENNAIVLTDKNKDSYHNYYVKNRDWILAKKKIINSQPHIKQRNKSYHHQYYLIHKEEFKRKNREYHKRKNGKNLSQV